MDLTAEFITRLLGYDSHSLTVVDVAPVVMTHDGESTPVLIVELVHDQLSEPFHLALRFVSAPMMRAMGEHSIAVANICEGDNS